ncbi:MAG: GcrA family cell cycle regulator [Pelagibacteraceae bacterium]|jgi:GcrA cell cycle regulator|nr:GcrA family cell cycle regulator [Pelagibacteraceae bacterium]|tara:strand:+ start:16708 stop:17208 length:501 start_codon:yes stop_codon:yes gene_type:complete
MGWTLEKVTKLKQLWGKGNTAAQIASIIGGVTRNAVIGKAYRLNLAVKTVQKKNNFNQVSQDQENAPQLERKTRKSRFNSLLLDKNFEPENPKSLEQLHDEICRWPIGHPNEPDFYFCGRKSMKDFSYCKLHILYAFQPKNKKEDLIEKDKDDEVPRFIKKKIRSA